MLVTGNPATDNLLRRIQGEYLEMPGLCLTHWQAQRLWGLDDETCAGVLDALVSNGFLVRAADGRYVRLTEGRVHTPARTMAKADISVRAGAA
jgi:hypothetical protein